MKESVLASIQSLPVTKTVDVVNAEDLSEQAFRQQFVAYNRPCLIKGAVKHWPAFTKWSDFDYLRQHVGHHPVSAFPHINYIDEHKFKEGKKRIKFDQALDQVSDENNQVFSIPSVVIRENGRFAELLDDIGTFKAMPKLPAPLRYPKKRFFLYKNAGTGWHTHPVDETLMCQVVGAKKVALVPSDNDYYHEFEAVARSDGYLRGEGIFDKIAAKLDLTLLTVEAGDALYIPPFWWHGVDAVDSQPGITLACCFRSPLHKLSNLRYPCVRYIWKDAFIKPSFMTLLVPMIGLITLAAQLVWRVKRWLRLSA